MFYWEIVSLDHVEMRSFAEVRFCLASSSEIVFATINRHGEVISFLIVRSTPHTHPVVSFCKYLTVQISW